jgi:hypothetical protein
MSQAWKIVTVVALVAVVGGGLSTWHGTAASTRSSVVVYNDGQVFDCGEGEIQPSLYFDDVMHIPVIPLDPDLNCTLRFFIENTSDTDVFISDITLPSHGIEFMSTPLVVTIDQREPIETGELGAVTDAAIHYDSPLIIAAHEIYPLDIRLEYNPGVCMSPGSTAWFRSGPLLSVSALGLAGEVQDRALYGYASTDESVTGC